MTINTWINNDLITIDTDTVWAETFAHWDALVETDTAAAIATATPRDIREVEAEATAMLCCAALQLPGVDDARGYIQHWYGAGQSIPEASVRRIFKAADAILKAGRPVKESHAELHPSHD